MIQEKEKNKYEETLAHLDILLHEEVDELMKQFHRWARLYPELQEGFEHSQRGDSWMID